MLTGVGPEPKSFQLLSDSWNFPTQSLFLSYAPFPATKTSNLVNRRGCPVIHGSCAVVGLWKPAVHGLSLLIVDGVQVNQSRMDVWSCNKDPSKPTMGVPMQAERTAGKGKERAGRNPWKEWHPDKAVVQVVQLGGVLAEVSVKLVNCWHVPLLEG
jgi:hypothetical protein